jgi:hypothetical protein
MGIGPSTRAIVGPRAISRAIRNRPSRATKQPQTKGASRRYASEAFSYCSPRRDLAGNTLIRLLSRHEKATYGPVRGIPSSGRISEQIDGTGIYLLADFFLLFGRLGVEDFRKDCLNDSSRKRRHRKLLSDATRNSDYANTIEWWARRTHIRAKIRKA